MLMALHLLLALLTQYEGAKPLAIVLQAIAATPVVAASPQAAKDKRVLDGSPPLDSAAPRPARRRRGGS